MAVVACDLEQRRGSEMKSTLKPGVTMRERIVIDRDRTIGFLGESARVYSTPSMVRDIEYTALKFIQEHLDEGESSVGIHVAVDHLAATPLDQWVDLELAIEDVDRRKVTVSATLTDAVEQVGRGTHVRFVIDVEKHAARLNEKIAKLREAR